MCPASAARYATASCPASMGYEAGLCCMGDHFGLASYQAPAEFVERQGAKSAVMKIFN